MGLGIEGVGCIVVIYIVDELLVLLIEH